MDVAESAGATPPADIVPCPPPIAQQVLAQPETQATMSRPQNPGTCRAVPLSKGKVGKDFNPLAGPSLLANTTTCESDRPLSKHHLSSTSKINTTTPTRTPPSPSTTPAHFCTLTSSRIRNKQEHPVCTMEAPSEVSCIPTRFRPAPVAATPFITATLPSAPDAVACRTPRLSILPNIFDDT